jgi:hypothetical protein
MKKKLTRTYIGNEVLCKECKTKKFKSFGNKEKYGIIEMHKKGCPYINKLKSISVKV